MTPSRHDLSMSFFPPFICPFLFPFFLSLFLFFGRTYFHSLLYVLFLAAPGLHCWARLSVAPVSRAHSPAAGAGSSSPRLLWVQRTALAAHALVTEARRRHCLVPYGIEPRSLPWQVDF